MIFTGQISELSQSNKVEYGFVFEERPDVELLGFIKHKNKNYYVNCIRCITCEKDPELFGRGLFTGILYDIRTGCFPCGCAGNVKWTESQWITLIDRKCVELGYTFNGWAEPYAGSTTLCNLVCNKHGQWSSNRASNLVKLNRGCPKCGAEIKSEKGKIYRPVSVTELDFFATGKFHPDTKFTHLGAMGKSQATYWKVECPVCGLTSKSQSSRLKLGSYSCGCNSLINQKEGYVNIVYDNSTPIALKFGISLNSKTRVKKQNVASVYKIENELIFDFPDPVSTRAAEQQCKHELVCGVVSKQEMPDGYTETTYLNNIDNIIRIYKNYGGILRT